MQDPRKYLKVLNERQKVLEFNDKDYEEFLDIIIEDIKNEKGEYALLFYENDFIDHFNILKYSQFNIAWTKSLNIFYKITDYYDTEDYYALIKPEYNRNGIRCAEIINNRYDVSSIVLIIPKNKLFLLKSVLRHEIKHLFYHLRKEISRSMSNLDIRFMESYNFYYEIPFEESLDKFLSTGETYNYDKKDDMLDDFIVKSLYYLNLNECRSNLEVIYHDFKDKLSNTIDNKYLNMYARKGAKYWNKDGNVLHMTYMSNTYLIYSLLYEWFTVIMDGNYEFKGIAQYIDEIYQIDNLKEFCEFACDRIDEEILSKSETIYTKIKNNQDI